MNGIGDRLTGERAAFLDDIEQVAEEQYNKGFQSGLDVAFHAVSSAVEGKCYARAVRSLVTKLRKLFAEEKES